MWDLGQTWFAEIVALRLKAENGLQADLDTRVRKYLTNQPSLFLACLLLRTCFNRSYVLSLAK
jgi:hypothetical protein